MALVLERVVWIDLGEASPTCSLDGSSVSDGLRASLEERREGLVSISEEGRERVSHASNQLIFPRLFFHGLDLWLFS